MATESQLPASAGTVIVGAGCVGCSAAYHLSELGRDDIVVVDQGPLFETGGSTSHAPGLVFQTNGSKLMTKMAKYTRELYSAQGDFQQCGGIEVAYTEDRWEFLKRKREWGRSYGIEGGELLSPAEVKAELPQVNEEVIHGGYYVPTDGKAHAVDASETMANSARDAGAAEFYGNTTVTNIETSDGSVDAVVTDNGRIEADEILLATNIWGPLFGDMVGFDVPLVPCAHQYLVSDPLEEFRGANQEIEQPMLRHQDASLYFRQHGDSYGVGSYNHEPLLVDPEDIYGPEKLDDLGLEYPSLREFTAEHFYENTHPDHERTAHEMASELVPAFEDCDFQSQINGMFSFTPDGMPILGESEDVDGLWWSLAIWVTQSGGAGNIVAEWMENGVPRLDGEPVDATPASISRFQGHSGSEAFAYDRGGQQYQEVYQLIHPREQPQSERGLRRGPYHQHQQELGAEFYDADGWESAQWYEANEDLLSECDVPDRHGWLGRNWSKAHGVEHQAVRDRVGVYDLTSFTCIEVSGEGALDFLQGLLSNDMDVGVGRVRYATMLDEDGGILADLTVSRLDEDEFLILTGGGSSGTTQGRWIRDHAPDDVQVVDRTSARAGMGVWGPDARKTLEDLVEADISHEEFPFFSVKETYVGSIPVTMLRVSYVGELGWELYTPMEYGAELWERIWESGEDHGIVAMGDATLNSMSMEKGFRLWGTDITPEYNPYEAGISFAVDLDTDFIGKDALLEAREEGIDQKLVPITLDTPGQTVAAGHPIVDPESDDVLGYGSRADYGYSIDAGIVYAYLPAAAAEPGKSVQVEYEGERYDATVRDEPLFDPGRDRMLR